MTTHQIDLSHSSATFAARHMMMSRVRGELKILSGTLEFDPANPAAASVEVVLDAASINSGDANRDNHLKSADFFNVEQFPQVTFRSTRVETTDGKKARIHGDLTLHGVTRPVELEARLLGEQKDPWGRVHVAFEASTRINREDWGLTWNVALEAGGWLVSKEIDIELEVQFIPVAETEAAAS